MPLVCQLCGQHPLPALPAWQEQINTELQAFQNIYPMNFASLRHTESNLVAYIERLKEEQEVATKALASIRVLLAPISKLTDDVLIHLFRQLFSPGCNHGTHASTEIVHRLTLVCRRWRNIIISIPSFWTGLYVPTPTLPSTSLRHYLDMQFERTRNLPLTLHCPSGLTTSLVDGLHPALDRITCLHLTPDLDETDATLESFPPLPNLIQLTFYGPQEDGGQSPTGEHESTWLDFSLPDSAVPRLTSVELCIINHWLFSLTLPWTQLARLSLITYHGTSIDLYASISKLERVEELELQFDADNGFNLAAGRFQITLQHLRTLKLTSYRANDIVLQLLQEANLPSLEELDISLLDGYHELGGIARSNKLSNLVKLRLEFCTNPSDDILKEFMDSLWTLRRIQTFCCSVRGGRRSTEYILHCLYQTNYSAEYLFPSLQSMKMDGADLSQETLRTLQEFIRCRVSCIDVPADLKKVLRGVQVSFIVCYTERQDIRPKWYNGKGTSVAILGNHRPTIGARHRRSSSTLLSDYASILYDLR